MHSQSGGRHGLGIYHTLYLLVYCCIGDGPLKLFTRKCYVIEVLLLLAGQDNGMIWKYFGIELVNIAKTSTFIKYYLSGIIE